MAKKTPPSKDFIIDKYMSFVLRHGTPDNVFSFAKENGFEESDFYTHYGTLDALEADIFNTFFDNTILTLEKSKDFKDYTPKDQLLSFYFTFFGNLTANRSYAISALENKNLEALKKLHGLRKRFLDFVDQLDFKLSPIKNKNIDQFKDHMINESYWLQMLVILKFWIEDASAEFEKTDIFIEKSVAASFDLIQTKPLKSIVDLGKFLVKEKIGMP